MSRLLPGLVLALTGCSAAPPPPEAPSPGPAEAAYQRAERFYEAGDYINSHIQCERALRVDPFHAPSRVLLHEVKFILGEQKIPATFLAQSRLAQVENCLEEGRRHLFFGDLVLAEQLATLALDLAPLLPPEMDVELRITQAQAILEWVRASRENEP